MQTDRDEIGTALPLHGWPRTDACRVVPRLGVFVGSPTISVTRMTGEGDVVVAEGTVRSARSEGELLKAVFCDVFDMKDAKIRRLTSYLMEVPLPGREGRSLTKRCT